MERLLNEREVAGVLGVSVQLLRKWRRQHREDFPHVTIGGCVRYCPEMVERFIERQTQRSATPVASPEEVVERNTSKDSNRSSALDRDSQQREENAL